MLIFVSLSKFYFGYEFNGGFQFLRINVFLEAVYKKPPTVGQIALSIKYKNNENTRIGFMTCGLVDYQPISVY